MVNRPSLLSDSGTSLKHLLATMSGRRACAERRGSFTVHSKWNPEPAFTGELVSSPNWS